MPSHMIVFSEIFLSKIKCNSVSTCYNKIMSNIGPGIKKRNNNLAEETTLSGLTSNAIFDIENALKLDERLRKAVQ